MSYAAVTPPSIGLHSGRRSNRSSGKHVGHFRSCDGELAGGRRPPATARGRRAVPSLSISTIFAADGAAPAAAAVVDVRCCGGPGWPAGDAHAGAGGLGVPACPAGTGRRCRVHVAAAGGGRGGDGERRGGGGGAGEWCRQQWWRRKGGDEREGQCTRAGEQEGEPATVRVPDQERERRPRRRLPVEEVRPEGRQEQRLPQELLPVHAPHVQREEAGAAAGQGHEHRGDHVRGRPQPPLREAHGGPQSHPQAASVPLAALTNQPCACGMRTRVRTYVTYSPAYSVREEKGITCPTSQLLNIQQLIPLHVCCMYLLLFTCM